MKRILNFFLLPFLITACNNQTNGPDVSGIKAEIQFERFEQHIFSIDTINPGKSLYELQRKFPTLLPLYIENILGLHDTTVFSGIRRFIRLNKFILDSVNNVFKNDEFLKNEFELAFKHVKYYKPDYRIPKLVTIIGPIDVLAQTSS